MPVVHRSVAHQHREAEFPAGVACGDAADGPVHRADFVALDVAAESRAQRARSLRRAIRLRTLRGSSCRCCGRRRPGPRSCPPVPPYERSQSPAWADQSTLVAGGARKCRCSTSPPLCAHGYSGTARKAGDGNGCEPHAGNRPAGFDFRRHAGPIAPFRPTLSRRWIRASVSTSAIKIRTE